MEVIPAELFLIRDGPLGGASGCVDGRRSCAGSGCSCRWASFGVRQEELSDRFTVGRAGEPAGEGCFVKSGGPLG